MLSQVSKAIFKSHHKFGIILTNKQTQEVKLKVHAKKETTSVVMMHRDIMAIPE